MHFMEPEDLLPCLQQPATFPCPELDQSNPRSSISFLEEHFNMSSHLRLGLPRSLFPSYFPTKPCLHLCYLHTCYILTQSHSYLLCICY
jgi:hypothetical protein